MGRSVYNSQYNTWITQGDSLSEEYRDREHKHNNVNSNMNNDVPYDLDYEYDSSYRYEPEPPSDEEVEVLLDEQYKKQLNIKRDEKGRLQKEVTLARKRSCDDTEIWRLYSECNYSVKEIVELKGCSKSTVYNVIKKHKEKEDAK